MLGSVAFAVPVPNFTNCPLELNFNFIYAGYDLKKGTIMLDVLNVISFLKFEHFVYLLFIY